MATVQFLIQSDKNPSPIYLRLRNGRNADIKFKTSYSISPNDWSKSKKQPKNIKDANGKSLMSELFSIRSKIITELNNSKRTIIITKEWIEKVISTPEVILAKDQDHYLQNCFDVYHDEKKTNSETKLSLLKKTKSVQALVKRYETKKRRKFLLLDVDVNWMSDFEKFLRSENYKQSYIFRNVKFIKMVGKYFKDLGYSTSTNFDSIKSKDKKAFKTYLNEDELRLIEEAPMPTESLENARDWLVISCHLGQRVSDLMRCSKKRIVMNGNKMLVDIRQKKTDQAVMVGVFEKVKEYLAKRDGDFPRPISDQRYNEYIKEVCKIAGLTHIEEGTLYDATTKRGIDGFYEKWQLVTSHVGRRSFATNYYGKVPIALLLVQTGHTTERAFLDYIGKGSIDKTSELLDYMERLYNRT
ncbi:hypothetical protein [Lacihabitans soyangensis]|uniref:Integrase n=1 Tax=Lacihabitans soyangensis TaxID=869394 RepID=A0AAE3H4R4_9BACT|nr:hypothetical protein [Lacihabitans soyangensis]MCP9765199.1 hypothetical protein [Lacihabitans soyangensis]